jgi:hypothetical protein
MFVRYLSRRLTSLLQHEGLYDVFRPEYEIARPCIFKALGWAKGRLSLKEYFCAFDLPLTLDGLLSKNPSPRKALVPSMTLVAVLAIFEVI